MSVIAEQPLGKELFLSAFARQSAVAESNGRAWLDSTRREAIERFESLGFPTRHQEGWRHTNLSAIEKTDFKTSTGEAAARLTPESVAPFAFGCLNCWRLTFVNGIFAPKLSKFEGLPKGFKLLPMSRALAEETEQIRTHLGESALASEFPFAALNTAFLQQGAFLHISRGAVLETPIHLLFLSGGEGATVSHPRTLIVAEEGSQATIVESYAGLDEEPYFTNAVTELSIGANSAIDHYKIQRESLRASHVGTQEARIARAANFRTELISLGAQLTRNDIGAVLNGEGIELNMNGLYMGWDSQHIDNCTRLDHAKPHCNSHEMYKGILDDKATGVFNGKIIVRPDAQKTDAKQSNKNLLLSDTARADAEPQLEIFADDVKCTHGATVGQLDEEHIFYLRSRGIDRKEATGLLTYAFANEIVENIRISEVREQLEKLIFERFHG